MSAYPANWYTDIRPTILARATDAQGVQRCESCGAANHEHHPITGGMVTLTTAHIYDPDPANCDPANLLGLCNKCHNWLDYPMRAMNRIRNRNAMQEAAGQMRLWSDG